MVFVDFQKKEGGSMVSESRPLAGVVSEVFSGNSRAQRKVCVPEDDAGPQVFCGKVLLGSGL